MMMGFSRVFFIPYLTPLLAPLMTVPFSPHFHLFFLFLETLFVLPLYTIPRMQAAAACQCSERERENGREKSIKITGC